MRHGSPQPDGLEGLFGRLIPSLLSEEAVNMMLVDPLSGYISGTTIAVMGGSFSFDVREANGAEPTKDLWRGAGARVGTFPQSTSSSSNKNDR